METIRLAEALERMETAEQPFTLRFVTFDKGRKTGGRIVEWANCRLSRPRRPRTSRQLAEQAAAQAGAAGGRAQRHYRHPTRNLLVGQSSQRRKVHIWLLLALDGVKIVL